MKFLKKKIKSVKLLKERMNGNGTLQEDHLLLRLYKRMVCLPDGTFSLTRMIVSVSFTFTVVFMLTAIILEIATGKVFSKNLYDMNFKLLTVTTGSYIATKVKDAYEKKSSKKKKKKIKK